MCLHCKTATSFSDTKASLRLILTTKACACSLGIRIVAQIRNSLTFKVATNLTWFGFCRKKTFASSQYEPSTASPSSLQQTPLAYCAIWKQDQPFSHAARGTFAQVRGKPCHCRCKLVTPNQALSLSLWMSGSPKTWIQNRSVREVLVTGTTRISCFISL